MTDALESLRAAKHSGGPGRKPQLCKCGSRNEVALNIQIRETHSALRTKSKAMCADCAVRIFDATVEAWA